MAGATHLRWVTVILAFMVVTSLAPSHMVRAGDNASSDAGEIALGRSLYATNCARCHGRNLEGQPDWQTRLPSGRLPAPPHDATGHSWHHPDKILIGITKHGLKPYAGESYESDMPAFAGALNDEEIAAVIEFIKSRWPEREREYQKRITASSK